MLYIPTIISVLEVLTVTVPVLLTVAFITVAERKTMASMQRRVGPNAVGWYGLLQAFADALKLLLKEYIAPTQANIILFFLGPIITLIFALLGYAVIPYGPGLVLLDFNLGILFLLAMSSLSTYGILLAGWSANSKYAFLGSLRSTAQLISYELVLSSAILLVVMVVGSLDITIIVEAQQSIWYIMPLFPIFIIFFIGSIAETNRAPFDLAEAESELVSGFMTEHSAVIFVFFFLAEYASIVLICIFNSLLFLGGYLFDFNYFFYPCILLTKFISGDGYMYLTEDGSYFNIFTLENYSVILAATVFGIIMGIKACIMIFTFIWARASFPRIRYDQLMSYCWTVLLPIVIAFIIGVPCILYSSQVIASNFTVICDGPSALQFYFEDSTNFYIETILNAKDVIYIVATALFLQIVYLLKDRCSPFFKWVLHNPPKPHAFTSSPLESSIIKKVEDFEDETDAYPKAGKLTEDCNNDPTAIKAKADEDLKEASNDKDKLISEIKDEKDRGNLDSDTASDLEERVKSAAKSLEINIKETSNVAVENIDDSEDTDHLMFPLDQQIFFPVGFLLGDIPVIRLLFLIYTGYKTSPSFQIKVQSIYSFVYNNIGNILLAILIIIALYSLFYLFIF